MTEQEIEKASVKTTAIIGGIFTYVGCIVFLIGFIHLNVLVAILGVLMMILGELVDLPDRMNHGKMES